MSAVDGSPSDVTAVEPVAELLARGERRGCVELSEACKLGDELGLDDDAWGQLCEAFEARGVTLRDDCGRKKAAPRFINSDLAVATGDALTLFLAEIGQYPLLSAADEVELAKRIEDGDENAKERMINANLRLVVHLAKRYQDHGLTLLDLIQERIFGLMAAAEKFDWRRGFRFSTYATLLIRQALLRALERQSRDIRLPGHVAENERRLARAWRELATRLARHPTDDELAEAAGMPVEQLRQVQAAARVVASLDQPASDEAEDTLSHMLPDRETLEENVEVSLEEESVRQAVASLPEPQRTVVRLRYGIGAEEPLTLSSVAWALDMTPGRVRRLEAHALTRLAERRELDAMVEAV